jgi:hypothetical protein
MINFRFATTAVALCAILIPRLTLADPAPAPAPAPPADILSDLAGAAEPPLVTPDLTHPVHLLSASTVETAGGSRVRLVTPGWFLADVVWKKLDDEVKRLQDAEVRLTAENLSFRTSASSSGPSWWVIASAVASGAALGWYVRGKL